MMAVSGFARHRRTAACERRNLAMTALDDATIQYSVANNSVNLSPLGGLATSTETGYDGTIRCVVRAAFLLPSRDRALVTITFDLIALTAAAIGGFFITLLLIALLGCDKPEARL